MIDLVTDKVRTADVPAQRREPIQTVTINGPEAEIVVQILKGVEKLGPFASIPENPVERIKQAESAFRSAIDGVRLLKALSERGFIR